MTVEPVFHPPKVTTFIQITTHPNTLSPHPQPHRGDWLSPGPGDDNHGLEDRAPYPPDPKGLSVPMCAPHSCILAVASHGATPTVHPALSSPQRSRGASESVLHSASPCSKFWLAMLPSEGSPSLCSPFIMLISRTRTLRPGK